jgi:hypothetical protein
MLRKSLTISSNIFSVISHMGHVRFIKLLNDHELLSNLFAGSVNHILTMTNSCGFLSDIYGGPRRDLVASILFVFPVLREVSIQPFFILHRKSHADGCWMGFLYVVGAAIFWLRGCRPENCEA